jgi:glycosyltransferase involved in cell wall biosynthesis
VDKQRIYIAIITFLPLVGGAEKQALAHGRSLRGRGFVTTIITLRHDRNWLSHEVIEGIPTIRVAGALLGGHEKLPRPLQRLLFLMALLVMCWILWRHRKRYDALHLYQLDLHALLVGLVCRLTHKPLIISIRNTGSGKRAKLPAKVSLLAGPLDATAPWMQVDEQAVSEGELTQLETLGKPVVRFTCSLLHHIHAVVVILSSRMVSYLAEHDFHLPCTQLIPNGVDIIRFHPSHEVTSISASEGQRDEQARIVICVSRLTYQKGIDVLLQAWRLVQRESLEARLIIVGIGPIQTQLECLARALGIRDSIEFVGLQHDVPAQLHRSSLAVLPSRWEGMPNALLEAMACGLPCIATRVSGSEDIIQHGVNGLLVEPEDYQAMALALLTLLRDPSLAQKYGHAARATIEKYYSLECITDRYIELYQRITGRRSKVAEATQPSET